ncbi:MAG: helix-turn-helix transcriptional regulator [Eubacteriales bacterium]|nr:helix-turn-helix transcriptional regulator [Eubacteriales bacterium]MDD3199735.1 helix-turn-helix transcriptional regulator [Eubacteriales bacterium]MDD4121328.1 helix-turn-helix transcriptional regulator [Eubacteriales bacterium]MDD4630173.1 helix-turn-helix transcriptional regulator [Eubacteriales bacterium]
MRMDKKALGAAIKATRVENKITQEQLAEMIGIAPSHVKQLESGNRSPSIEVLYKLAHTLNFSIDEIFFPKRTDDKQLLYKIERSLQDCSVHDLKVVYSTISALKDKEDKED